eukprot:scaffold2871_cov381-Prasinococcus_capsulatus_cf.AAC.12
MSSSGAPGGARPLGGRSKEDEPGDSQERREAGRLGVLARNSIAVVPWRGGAPARGFGQPRPLPVSTVVQHVDLALSTCARPLPVSELGGGPSQPCAPARMGRQPAAHHPGGEGDRKAAWAPGIRGGSKASAYGGAGADRTLTLSGRCLGLVDRRPSDFSHLVPSHLVSSRLVSSRLASWTTEEPARASGGALLGLVGARAAASASSCACV